MSVKSESQSPPVQSKNKKNVEILESGVSIVKPTRRYRRSVAILTRIFFAVIFLGMGVLAVVYSISTSEEKQAADRHNIPESVFDIFHNQISWKGKITIEKNSTDGKRAYLKYDLVWLQDDTHSRLLFNVSNPEVGYNNLFYVFENHTLQKTDNKCTFYPITYESFIWSFGVIGLQKTGNDSVKMDNRDDFERVEAFEGVPIFNHTDRYHGMPGYDNGDPKIAFAYSFPKKGATCGWQVYFDSNDKDDPDHIEWVEYWFNDIIDEEPDAEYFVGYTEDCFEGNYLTSTPQPQQDDILVVD